MAEPSATNVRDHCGVWVPPPVLYAALFLLAMLLDGLVPLPLVPLVPEDLAGIAGPGLIAAGTLPHGMDAMRQIWQERVTAFLGELGFTPPEGAAAITGGRLGQHTAELGPLYEELTVVYRIDPEANW